MRAFDAQAFGAGVVLVVAAALAAGYIPPTQRRARRPNGNASLRLKSLRGSLQSIDKTKPTDLTAGLLQVEETLGGAPGRLVVGTVAQFGRNAPERHDLVVRRECARARRDHRAPAVNSRAQSTKPGLIFSKRSSETATGMGRFSPAGNAALTSFTKSSFFALYTSFAR
jgi:hypothetical protein